MPYSLKQAAEATGRTKPTILRSIQLGKISAKKDEHGEWQIDPAELHRVYPSVSQDEPLSVPVDDRATQRELELLRQMLADKDRQIERMEADKNRQITSLTEQLKAADEERRTTLRQLTALLTDQRAKQSPSPDVISMPPLSAPAEAPPPLPEKEMGWFRRMMGGK